MDGHNSVDDPETLKHSILAQAVEKYIQWRHIPTNHQMSLTDVRTKAVGIIPLTHTSEVHPYRHLFFSVGLYNCDFALESNSISLIGNAIRDRVGIR